MGADLGLVEHPGRELVEGTLHQRQVLRVAVLQDVIDRTPKQCELKEPYGFHILV